MFKSNSKNVIYLFWYKLNINHGNFGDELSHYIVSKLSGCEVKRIIIPKTGLKYIYQCFII